jgi:hypothetical protein
MSTVLNIRNSPWKRVISGWVSRAYLFRDINLAEDKAGFQYLSDSTKIPFAAVLGRAESRHQRGIEETDRYQHQRLLQSMHPATRHSGGGQPDFSKIVAFPQEPVSGKRKPQP